MTSGVEGPCSPAHRRPDATADAHKSTMLTSLHRLHLLGMPPLGDLPPRERLGAGSDGSSPLVLDGHRPQQVGLRDAGEKTTGLKTNRDFKGNMIKTTYNE